MLTWLDKRLQHYSEHVPGKLPRLIDEWRRASLAPHGRFVRTNPSEWARSVY